MRHLLRVVSVEQLCARSQLLQLDESDADIAGAPKAETSAPAIEAIDRVHHTPPSASRSSESDMAASIQRTLRRLVEFSRAPQVLVGEKARKFYFIDPNMVEYVEADGNYVNIHTATDRYVTRNTLKSLAATVRVLGFIRIERSRLINLHQVAFLERLRHGRYAFTLRSGEKVISGPSYRGSIRAAMKCASRTPSVELEDPAASQDQSAGDLQR
jgi:DNA-binding LytR/AlgR family response regulator